MRIEEASGGLGAVGSDRGQAGRFRVTVKSWQIWQADPEENGGSY